MYLVLINFTKWLFCMLDLQTANGPKCSSFTSTRNYDHISPVLSKLHWLPIKHHIDLKILLITYSRQLAILGRAGQDKTRQDKERQEQKTFDASRVDKMTNWHRTTNTRIL